jgi:transcription factor CON7
LLEFKEIRKEWKAKKKEEEAARKAEEERNRPGDSRDSQSNGPPEPIYGGRQNLPPMGYTPAASQAPTYGQQSPAIDGISPYVS